MVNEEDIPTWFKFMVNPYGPVDNEPESSKSLQLVTSELKPIKDVHVVQTHRCIESISTDIKINKLQEENDSLRRENEQLKNKIQELTNQQPRRSSWTKIKDIFSNPNYRRTPDGNYK